MLPVNVPAILDTLPEEDRLETVERYILPLVSNVLSFPKICWLLGEISESAQELSFQAERRLHPTTP